MVEQKRLLRSQPDRMAGGVCAGLGRYLGVDPLLFRVAFAALALVNGVGLILYLIAWVIIPDEAGRSLTPEEATRANLKDMGSQLRTMFRSVSPARGSMLVGLFLIGAGVWFLLKMFFPDFNLNLFWPIVLIAAGLYLLVIRRR